MTTRTESARAKKGRIPLPAQVAAIWVAVYLFLKLFIKPPLPFSLIFMYMTLTLVALLIYVSIYEDVLRAFVDPLRAFLRGDTARKGPMRLTRWAVLAVIPLLIGLLAFQRVSPRYEPPLGQRVIHPAPPAEVMGLANPLRRHPERLKESIKEGARVYFENCVFCHGDRFDGKGVFAHGFNPPPANFADQGTIAQLQESYVYWRITAGGPGLPDESAPWDSAMPRWEGMLSEEDRWEAVLYLYDATGWTPRTWE